MGETVCEREGDEAIKFTDKGHLAVERLLELHLSGISRYGPICSPTPFPIFTRLRLIFQRRLHFSKIKISKIELSKS